jgi:hypothetical protein
VLGGLKDIVTVSVIDTIRFLVAVCSIVSTKHDGDKKKKSCLLERLLLDNA